MPKINVYLPDDLADAVKEAGLPVSAICQRALEQAVRRITAIRETALDGVDGDALATRLPNFTARARTAISGAVGRSRDAARSTVTTADLLGGIVAEGGNLALQVLSALEVDPTAVRDEAARSPIAEPGEAGGSPAPEDTRRFSLAAANALEAAVGEATALGHNYVGCEHLLLGLVGEPDGAAGKALRSFGAEPRLTRRAVSAALAGYVHLRAQLPSAGTADPAGLLAAAVRRELQPLIVRIERLEQSVGA